MTTRQASKAANGSVGYELSDTQLDEVIGGSDKSQEAFDILIEHGDELTFKEQAACAWVWLFGCKASPEGEPDYRPHGDTPTPPGGR
jgi:hypothetical protein